MNYSAIDNIPDLIADPLTEVDETFNLEISSVDDIITDIIIEIEEVLALVISQDMNNINKIDEIDKTKRLSILETLSQNAESLVDTFVENATVQAKQIR